MNALMGTVKNGLVVLDEPGDLPDGSRVVVQPVESLETFGVSEADWRDSPQAIADWIGWYDSLEPIELTAAAEAEFAAFRERQKELGKTSFDERSERLRMPRTFFGADELLTRDHTLGRGDAVRLVPCGWAQYDESAVGPKLSRCSNMNVAVTNAAKIAVTGLPDDERRRVHAWFDHLKNWPTDREVQKNSTRVLPEQEPNVYVLRTTSDVRIFFTVDDDEITVVDVARKDALRTVKANHGQ